MRLAIWFIVTAALVLACAVEAPPPGGPVDEIVPAVTGTNPTGDSAGVDPGSPISITFSEDMTRAGVERLVSFSPPIEIGRVWWKDRTVFIQPLEPLHPDTTYVVKLRPGFRDNHKVSSKEDHVWAFATSAAIDSGSISGTIHFRREPTSKGVVGCFVLPVDSSFVPQAALPDRETVTDESGNYTLRYLPSEDNRYIVWAFQDANGNGLYQTGDEYAALAADTVVLTPNAPFAAGVDIFVVDPTEAATLAGVVVNRTGIDTIGVSVGLYADTVETPQYLVSCDTTGAYSFGSVKMGSYILRAFIDVAADSVCGWYVCFDDTTRLCAEPCAVLPDTLTIEPGDELELDPVVLEPADRRKEAP